MSFLEITFSVAIIAGVILIGLLISIGNERQRKAIESIWRTVEKYAIESLQMQRVELASKVRIDDPVAWCNRLVKTVLQTSVQINSIVAASKPDALVLQADRGQILALSPVSPDQARRITKQATALDRQNAAVTALNPLFPYPRGVTVTELSLLNTSVVFDIEMQQVWSTQHKGAAPAVSIWYLYELPLQKSAK